MQKLKLFLENFLIYGLGGVISGIIPLIMIPIVTKLMPDSSYIGISDMQTTLVSFSSAFAVFGMYDSMYRMYFEKEDIKYRNAICSTTLLFTFFSSIIVALIMVIFSRQLSTLFFQNAHLNYLVYIASFTTIATAITAITRLPTRMQNKRITFIFTNILSSVIAYGISIPLLLDGHYIIALPLGSLLSAVCTMLIFCALNYKWFHISQFHFKYLTELLWVAAPLVPSVLIYWIFNSSDRLMITNILGTTATGIYTIGSKLGQASQLIYTAFASGWQYFAFSTMKDNNQVESNSLVFEYLGIISFAATALCCLFAYPIYQLLFTGEYVSSYLISPYLFLAPLLQMLYQTISNQFLVVKVTWPSLLILGTGAVSNVGFNLLLIPKIGIEGAAIATLIGYIISVVICAIVLIKMKLMVISREFLIAVGAMLVFFFVWRFLVLNTFVGTFVLTAFLIATLAFLYRMPITFVFKNIRKRKPK